MGSWAPTPRSSRPPGTPGHGGPGCTPATPAEPRLGKLHAVCAPDRSPAEPGPSPGAGSRRDPARVAAAIPSPGPDLRPGPPADPMFSTPPGPLPPGPRPGVATRPLAGVPRRRVTVAAPRRDGIPAAPG